jgi:hypothetical protein
MAGARLPRVVNEHSKRIGSTPTIDNCHLSPGFPIDDVIHVFGGIARVQVVKGNALSRQRIFGSYTATKYGQQINGFFALGAHAWVPMKCDVFKLLGAEQK